MAAARLGGYDLLHRIAVGGMAEVFLARKAGPEGFEKRVALKRILPHLSDQPDFVHMFLDEARLAARLEHPHIVHIQDCGRDGDTYWLAMEYVAGEDLQTILRQAEKSRDRLPFVDVAMLLLQACEGLHHAHENGIVHRDVTPSNLLLSFDGVLKLADFGIAKAEACVARTHAGALKGKIAYMSPEQARGESVDRRSDVYSLAVCGWELLTGRRLRLADSDLDLLGEVQAGIVLPPSTICPVPDELETILLRALAPDPEARFPTARAFGEALGAFVAQSGEVPSPVRLGEWLKRLFPDPDRTRSIEIPLEPTAPLQPLVAAPPQRMSLHPHILFAHMLLSAQALNRRLPRVELPRFRLLLPLIAILLSSLGLILAMRSPHSVPRLEPPPTIGVMRPVAVQPIVPPQALPTTPARREKTIARKRTRH